MKSVGCGACSPIFGHVVMVDTWIACLEKSKCNQCSS